MKEAWDDRKMPPISLRDTPQECIGELINAIIVEAYSDYFGGNAYHAADAQRWFRTKEYKWLTTAPLEKYLDELIAFGSKENPKNEGGGYGREGRYQNRFFTPNAEVRRAMTMRNLRVKDLANMLFMSEAELSRLLESEQSAEVQQAWIRICLRQPYRYKGKRYRLRKNFEHEECEE